MNTYVHTMHSACIYPGNTRPYKLLEAEALKCHKLKKTSSGPLEEPDEFKARLLEK